jgi:hypothetical protein
MSPTECHKVVRGVLSSLRSAKDVMRIETTPTRKSRYQGSALASSVPEEYLGSDVGVETFAFGFEGGRPLERCPSLYRS